MLFTVQDLYHFIICLFKRPLSTADFDFSDIKRHNYSKASFLWTVSPLKHRHAVSCFVLWHVEHLKSSPPEQRALPLSEVSWCHREPSQLNLGFTVNYYSTSSGNHSFPPLQTVMSE